MEKVSNAFIEYLLKVLQGCNRCVPNNKPIIHCVELEDVSGPVYDGLLARLCHFVPSVKISDSEIVSKTFYYGPSLCKFWNQSCLQCLRLCRNPTEKPLRKVVYIGPEEHTLDK